MPPLPPDGSSKAGETIGSTPDAAPRYPVPAGYRVLRPLGEGGMGAVFLALDERLEREVALKYLLSQDAETRGRFRREGRLLAQLKHPNIVEVFASEVIDDIPVLACEYVEGEDLRSWLRREGLPGACARGLEIAEHILEALAHAHGAGIVHRDLKSENVLLSRKGETKLADFGIAAGGEGGTVKTRAGQIFGTPAYMAPEQIESMAVDGRADLYSLGVILFEVFTGRLPFESPDMMQLLRMKQTRPPPRPERVAPWIPLSLATVILRLLEKDPAARYPDAAEVLEALRAIPDEDRRFLVLKVKGAGARPAADSDTEKAAPSRTRTTGVARTVSPRRTANVPVAPPPDRRLRVLGVAAIVILGAIGLRAARRVPEASPTLVRGSPSIAAPATPKEARAMSIPLIEKKVLVTSKEVYLLVLSDRPVRLAYEYFHGTTRATLEERLRTVAPLTDEDGAVPATWHAARFDRPSPGRGAALIRVRVAGTHRDFSLIEVDLPSATEAQASSKAFFEAVDFNVDRLSREASDAASKLLAAGGHVERVTTNFQYPVTEQFLDPAATAAGKRETLLQIFDELSMRDAMSAVASPVDLRKNQYESIELVARELGMIGSVVSSQDRARYVEPLVSYLDPTGIPPIPEGAEGMGPQASMRSEHLKSSAAIVLALCRLQDPRGLDAVVRFLVRDAAIWRTSSAWEAERDEADHLRAYLEGWRHLRRYAPQRFLDAGGEIRGDDPWAHFARAYHHVLAGASPEEIGAFLASESAPERRGALEALQDLGVPADVPSKAWVAWAGREAQAHQPALVGGLALGAEASRNAWDSWMFRVGIGFQVMDARFRGAPGGPVETLLDRLETGRAKPELCAPSGIPEDRPGAEVGTFARSCLYAEGWLLREVARHRDPPILGRLAGATSSPWILGELLRGYLTMCGKSRRLDFPAGWRTRVGELLRGCADEGAQRRLDPKGHLVIGACAMDLPGWPVWARRLGGGNLYQKWVAEFCRIAGPRLFGSSPGDPAAADGTVDALRGATAALEKLLAGTDLEDPSVRLVLLDPVSRPLRTGLTVEAGSKVELRAVGFSFPREIEFIGDGPFRRHTNFQFDAPPSDAELELTDFRGGLVLGTSVGGVTVELIRAIGDRRERDARSKTPVLPPCELVADHVSEVTGELCVEAHLLAHRSPEHRVEADIINLQIHDGLILARARLAKDP